MREYSTEDGVKRILKKLYKKDRAGYNQVMGKLNEILTCENVEHYKNLRKPLQHLKRVQIGSFVLTFRYDKKEDKVTFYDYDHNEFYRNSCARTLKCSSHHDKIYK